MRAKLVNEAIKHMPGKSKGDLKNILKEKREKKQLVFKFFEYVLGAIEDEDFWVVIGEDLEGEVLKGYLEFIENWNDYENILKNDYGLIFPEIPNFEETEFEVI